MDMRSTGELQGIFDDLDGVLDRLSDVDVAGLSERATLDALKDLQPLVWAVQAQVSRLVGVVHETAAVGADGYLSTASWLTAFLRVGDGPAQVRAAKALSAVPEMKALFGSGGCGPDHVRL
jgi:hypothetical protein